MFMFRNEISIFWNFVNQQTSFDRRDFCFGWISDLVSLDLSQVDALSHEALSFLFQAISKLDPQKFTLPVFSLFYKCFFRVNAGIGKIDVKIEQKNVFFSLRTAELDGLQYLWDLAAGAQNETVSSEASNLLISIYSKEIENDGGVLREKFVETCISQFKKSMGKDMQNSIVKVLHLVERFLVFEASIPTDEKASGTPKILSSGDTISVAVAVLKGQNFSMNVSSAMTLLKLKLLIALRIKCNYLLLRLFVPGGELRDDNVSLKDAGLVNESRITVSQKTGKGAESIVAKYGTDPIPKNSPGASEVLEDEKLDLQSSSRLFVRASELLSQRPENFQLLFSLLQKSDEVASKAWFLLCSLPVNLQIQEKLSPETFANQESIDWVSCFDCSSVFHLLYSLRVSFPNL
jgi:hypothetical protein